MKRLILQAIAMSGLVCSAGVAAGPVIKPIATAIRFPSPAVVVDARSGVNCVVGAVWLQSSMELRIEIAEAFDPRVDISAHSLDSLRLVPLTVLRDCEGWDATFVRADNPALVRRFSVSGGMGRVETGLVDAPQGGVLMLRFRVTPGSPGETAQERADLNGDGVVDSLDIFQFFSEISEDDSRIVSIVTGTPECGGGAACVNDCFIQACDVFDFDCEGDNKP